MTVKGKNILLRNVPAELHRRFKAKCAEKGGTIQGQILLLMRKYCKAPKEAKGA